MTKKERGSENTPHSFHECEIKYKITTPTERNSLTRRVQELGFTFQKRQLETDFLPDTSNFLLRQNSLLLRFRRMITADNSDVLLTLKSKGTAITFQEYFEQEYPFSDIKNGIFSRINDSLIAVDAPSLPYSIHEHDASHFEQLIADVKKIFPAHRILLEKKRSLYTRHDGNISFDTLPEGISDYLEIEASSPQKLERIKHELALDKTRIELIDYGDILKRHNRGKPDILARTGLFNQHERTL